MKCPGCQIDFTPIKSWRSEFPDKRLVAYGVIPNHKPVTLNMYGYGMASASDDPCDWVGHVLPLEEAEAKKIT